MTGVTNRRRENATFGGGSTRFGAPLVAMRAQ
jgi:hypothetical protein